MEIEYIYEGEEFLYFNIWVTNECNYNCLYCYEENKKHESNMNQETANRVVEYIFECCREKNIDAVWMNFHGGEPMLNREQIKYIINCFRERKGTLKLYTSMTTNCSIYDNEMTEYISELTVSIDGDRESHDKNRILRDGSGTYDLSIQNAQKYLMDKGSVRLRMVVTPNNVSELCNNVMHLYKLGFREIIPGIDYYDENWTEELFDEVLFQFQKLQKHREKKQIKDVRIGILDDTVKEKGKCVVGCDGYQISSDGKLYPCLLVADNPYYCIGDIYSGLDYKAINKINKINQKDVEQCADCGNYKYCITSRCLFLNEQLTGSCFCAAANVCALENVKLKLWGII